MYISLQKPAIFLLAIAMLVLCTPPSKAATLVPRRLDGVYVPTGKENLWPIAVMVDNHTAARPQSNLQKASIVYESLAEGGIPRFMAVYADPSIGTIGPIRSTRPYFVRFAAEYTAALAHAGGSPDGMKTLKQMKLMNLEGLKKPTAKFFFRAYGGGVHGLYTSMGKLWKFIAATHTVKVAKPNYFPRPIVDDAPVEVRGKDKSGVSIDLGYGKLYDVKYVYNKKLNSYMRFTGGRAHKDRQTKSQISVKNVIIEVTPKEKVLDRKGRLDIKIIGSGKGVLFQNGISQPITWKKSSARGKTVYRNVLGEEISLVRGNTWITIAPKGHNYKIF